VEESKLQKKISIRPKGQSKLLEQEGWEREEVNRENERTIKKLAVEVARL
jgi:hypothetical protein